MNIIISLLSLFVLFSCLKGDRIKSTNKEFREAALFFEEVFKQHCVEKEYNYFGFVRSIDSLDNIIYKLDINGITFGNIDTIKISDLKKIECLKNVNKTEYLKYLKIMAKNYISCGRLVEGNLCLYYRKSMKKWDVFAIIKKEDVNKFSFEFDILDTIDQFYFIGGFPL